MMSDLIQNAGGGIELRMPPDRLDLAMEQARVLLEAGYDVAIERVFNEEFVPPKLLYYVVDVVCEMNMIDDAHKEDGS